MTTARFQHYPVDARVARLLPLSTGTIRGQAERRTSTYIVHKKNADDRQANDFRSHGGG